MSKIVLNIVTYNKLHRMWENVLIMKEYFDEVRIIDGNSTDGTKEFCELHGLTYIPYELGNSIVAGYNKVLESGSEGEWLVICDSDEWFTRVFMRNMRRMVEESRNGEEINVISTVPLDMNADVPIYHSYEQRVEMQQIPVPLAEAFKKEVMFKWYPELKYVGTNHHYLEGPNKKPLYIYYGYYHARTIQDICESSVYLLSGDILAGDLNFPAEHFSVDEINYLKKMFKIKKIQTIPGLHKFFDIGKFPKKFIELCENCFMENGINMQAQDNGSIVAPRMAWFLYMFYFRYPKLGSDKAKAYLQDKVFCKDL